MLISVKMLTKYVIIIYTVGSVLKKLGVWIKAVPKAKFPAGLGEKNGKGPLHMSPVDRAGPVYIGMNFALG